MTTALLAGLLGALLGSVPFGLLLTRVAGLGDIRSIGSGSIGATNVLRTGRKDLALLTLLLDAGKGAITVLVAALFGPLAAVAAALGAVVGHMFTPWLGFRGGKGVATALGVILAISWPVGLALIGVWLAMAALFRMSSLAALTACALSPLLSWLLASFPGSAPHPERTILIAIIAILIAIRHHENIRRLLAGTEPPIKLSGGRG